jgi:hypothetical protein
MLTYFQFVLAVSVGGPTGLLRCVIQGEVLRIILNRFAPSFAVVGPVFVHVIWQTRVLSLSFS